MVKKLKYDDFLSELDKFYTESKDKYSVYLTFKRAYKENFKFKRNAKARKKRMVDRKNQEKDNSTFNVLVRAKLRKKRVQTIVSPEELSSFHHTLTNVLTLHFIREEKAKKNKKENAIKKVVSKTQKRKIKRLKKIKAKEGDKMQIEKP